MLKKTAYLGPHLQLKAFGSFSDALRDFVIIRRQTIRVAVCSVVQRFPEAVVDGADYLLLFSAMVS